MANWSQGTVTPVNLSTDSVGSPIPAGSGSSGTPFVGGVNPYQVTVAPDGATAYLGDDNSDTVTPITVATDTPQTNISLSSGPEGIAITPDQAPIASFAVTRARAGLPTRFDASTSTVKYGTIVSYSWDFGDGSTEIATTPTVTHIYSRAGTYTASVTETDTAGTSTTEVFNGTTMSRNGGPTARATQTVHVGGGLPPARVSILTNSVIITQDGDLAIRLRCPAHVQGGCRGTLTLRLARHYAGPARCARGCRPLARKHFAIAAGRSALVNVLISPYGRKLLAAAHTLHVTVTATTVAHGRAATAVKTDTLRARPSPGKDGKDASP